MTLTAAGAATEVRYDYSVEIGGKVAAIGGRMLDGAASLVIGQFFKRLTANFEDPGAGAGAGAAATGQSPSLCRWLLRVFGAGK